MANKNRQITAVSIMAIFVLLACGVFTTPSIEVSIPPETLAEQTWSVMQTIAALSATPTFTRAPATDTPPPPPPPPCLAAKLIRHITIPDGSFIPRNTSFTKVWRIQNTGSCTWDSSISIAPTGQYNPFFGTPVPLPQKVKPGKTIDLAVNLLTPGIEGNYTGYWILQTKHESFGDGGDKPFRVNVSVSDSPPNPIYDFAANRCQALWQSNARMVRNRCQLTSGSGSTLPCNGKKGNPVGFVIRLENFNMESGPIAGLPGLWTNPPILTGGVIQGIFPALLIQSGDIFTAQVGCLEGNPNCNVTFDLRYQVILPPSTVISENTITRAELYEGSLSSYNIDLGALGLAGQYVSFIFRVTGNNDLRQNASVWVAPRIER